MKRRYRMTVEVSFTDEQASTATTPAGPALRARCESAEAAIVFAIGNDAARSIRRSRIVATVMRSEVLEDA